MSWREILAKLNVTVHPACDTLPMLDGIRLAELRDAIRARGMRVRLALWRPDEASPFELIGGRNRSAVLADEPDGEAKIAAALERAERFTGGDPWALVRDFDVTRRQLSDDQRRAALAELLKAHPERSNRSIAAEARVSHHTAARVRKDLEHGGQIAHHETRVGSDGVAQPAAKPVRVAHVPAPQPKVPPPRQETAEEFRRRMRAEQYEEQQQGGEVKTGADEAAERFKTWVKNLGPQLEYLSSHQSLVGRVSRSDRVKLAIGFTKALALSVAELERFENAPTDIDIQEPA